MSELNYFLGAEGRVAVALPFACAQIVEEYQALRRQMLKQVAEGFSRDEWAYLASFLAKENLETLYETHFGKPAGSGQVRLLARPLEPVAVWLPNNVSMLGPLTFILLSLTGARLELKAGSAGEDLTTAFLDYARQAAPEGTLGAYLRERVQVERFGRNDPRNAAMAARAAARIVFGSDAACQAIHALPHPAGSTAISFRDHRSEAWLDAATVTDAQLIELIKVFVIFGQAGCTSPSRAVLLNGSREQALELRSRLLRLWPQVVRADVPQHMASRNVRDVQLMRALGWEAFLAPRNAAVLCLGERSLPLGETALALSLSWATPAEAVAALPENIQTIGHAIADAGGESWLHLLAGTGVCRFVPIREMHHFGAIWDGQRFWSQLFHWMPVSL
jgi:hypothetical protein